MPCDREPAPRTARDFEPADLTQPGSFAPDCAPFVDSGALDRHQPHPDPRRHAHDQLIRAYRAAVVGVVRQLIEDDSLVDDVVQQTLFEAIRDDHALRRPASLRPWLLAIASHRAIDALRIRNRRRRREVAIDLDQVDAIADDRPSPDQALGACHRDQAVRDALERLPPRLRHAVQLRYRDGCTYPQIAAILDENAASVRVRVVRALVRLRRRFGPPADRAAAK